MMQCQSKPGSLIKTPSLFRIKMMGSNDDDSNGENRLSIQSTTLYHILSSLANKYCRLEFKPLWDWPNYYPLNFFDSSTNMVGISERMCPTLTSPSLDSAN